MAMAIAIAMAIGNSNSNGLNTDKLIDTMAVCNISYSVSAFFQRNTLGKILANTKGPASLMSCVKLGKKCADFALSEIQKF